MKNLRMIGLGFTFLLLWGAPASPFGIDFQDSLMGTGFEVDVYVEGTELADPYDDILFFAWQSSHKGGADLSPEVGGHWGFQILPIWRNNQHQPCFTFNFGWEFDYAVLPLGVTGMVISDSHPEPYVIDISARMKAEIEDNIAANPTNPNLFLSYGAGRSIKDTVWSEETYNYIPWHLNTWYRVSFTRDESPITTTAWVLKQDKFGVYYFPNQPESVTVFGWHIKIQPEIQNPDGTFDPNGPAMELPALYLGAEFDRLHTFTTWGEAFDDRPRFPIILYQKRPRVTSSPGAVHEITCARGNYWGYDQPSNTFGPVDNSQINHTFYLGYNGTPIVDNVQFELLRRSTRDGAVLWDNSLPYPGILPESEILQWPEDTIRAYFTSLSDVAYLANEVMYEGQTLYVNRLLKLSESNSPWFEYSRLYGSQTYNLKFDVHASDSSWLVKNNDGFQIVSPPDCERFDIEVEVYDPSYINRVGWLHFEVIPNVGPMCVKPIQGDVSGDCRLDSADLAIICSHWLECNLTEFVGRLIAHWKFDETTGSVAHDSAGNNHGSLSQAGTYWAVGHEGGALNFTGEDSCVEIPDNPSLNPTKAVSFTVWIKPNWTGNNRVLQKGMDDNQYRLLREWDDFVFHLTGVSNGRLDGVGCPAQGEWHHVSATYNGSVMKLFYDGLLVKEQNASGEINVTLDCLYIGTKYAWAPLGDAFNGLIDDVRIYDYALSSQEIAGIFEGVSLPDDQSNLVCSDYPVGDLNEDCATNFWDFSIIAFHWLEDNNL